MRSGLRFSRPHRSWVPGGCRRSLGGRTAALPPGRIGIGLLEEAIPIPVARLLLSLRSVPGGIAQGLSGRVRLPASTWNVTDFRHFLERFRITVVTRCCLAGGRVSRTLIGERFLELAHPRPPFLSYSLCIAVQLPPVRTEVYIRRQCCWAITLTGPIGRDHEWWKLPG